MPLRTSSGSSVNTNEYDLIQNLQRDLEVTGMASVAAAKALEVQQLPLAAMAGVAAPGPQNLLLQNIQQPLPPSSLAGPGLPQPADPTTPSTASLEDADAQISLLLKTMQQQPGVKLPDEDKVSLCLYAFTFQPLP